MKATQPLEKNPTLHRFLFCVISDKSLNSSAAAQQHIRTFVLRSSGSKPQEYWTRNGFLHQLMTDSTYSPGETGVCVVFHGYCFVVCLFELLHKLIDQTAQILNATQRKPIFNGKQRLWLQSCGKLAFLPMKMKTFKSSSMHIEVGLGLGFSLSISKTWVL